MKIEWAPLEVPMERRRQTFAMAFFIFSFMIVSLGSYVLVAALLVSKVGYWLINKLSNLL